MTSIRQLTLKKYFASLTIANQDWTWEQKEEFARLLNEELGAERQHDYENLYLFEIKAYSKTEAQTAALTAIASALNEIGLTNQAFYLSLFTSRGFNAQIIPEHHIK